MNNKQAHETRIEEIKFEEKQKRPKKLDFNLLEQLAKRLREIDQEKELNESSSRFKAAI